MQVSKDIYPRSSFPPLKGALALTFLRRSGHGLSGLGEITRCFGVLALLQIGDRPVVVCLGIAGIELDGLRVVFDRFVDLPLLELGNAAEIVRSLVLRVNTNDLGEITDRVVQLSHMR